MLRNLFPLSEFIRFLYLPNFFIAVLSPFCCFLSVLGQNTFVATLFSLTLNLCSLETS